MSYNPKHSIDKNTLFCEKCGYDKHSYCECDNEKLRLIGDISIKLDLIFACDESEKKQRVVETLKQLRKLSLLIVKER